MSYNSLNVHTSPLAIKREPFDSTVAIKLESLESPKHSYSAMHHMANASSDDLLKCKKRGNFTKLTYPSVHTPHQPSVARRNERERNRVKMVNNGFATLRQHVPNGAKNKKMSKVETLRSAVEYIRQLQKLLGSQGNESTFSLEQYSNSSQVPSTSGDENCYPSPLGGHHMASPSMESTVGLEHMSYASQVAYSSMAGSMYSPTSSEMSSKLNTYCLPSPSMAERISPAPSVGSDITSSSSPYDSHSLLDSTAARQTASVANEEEMFDFSNWF